MEASRVGQALRAARTRAGWSREALAFHSGVSWSAIAQIESGRRKDVRLSSLTALANALGLSVDHLVGSAAAATPPDLFEHQVLVYGSDEAFVATAIPFLAHGIEQSDRLLAITTPAKTALLRSTLGARAELVEFADWAEWYRSPTNALRQYREFLKAEVTAGAVWIRVVAEAAWQGATGTDLAAWNRYEALVNLAFASSPATILCTYDERVLSPAVVAEAYRTHPEIVRSTDATASAAYQRPEDYLLGASSPD